MESVLKSDIFFFITTICVCILTAMFIAVLGEIFRTARNVRIVTDKIRKEAESFTDEFASFRATLRDTQFGMKPIFDAIKRAVDDFTKAKPKKNKPASPKKQKEENPIT